jgi:hypothetical protein
MASDDTIKLSTPVYVPYATLISSLENLRTHGIPGTGKIDKSLWDTQSGAIQGQLLIAYRFLGFINDQNQVLPALPPVVKASEAERKVLLKAIIEDKYRNVISQDLNTISSGQLDDAFKAFNVSGSTLVRAIRFFVKACEECGIPISKRISAKTRATGTTPRKRRSQNGAKRDDLPPTDPLSGKENPPVKAIEDKLLDKFPAFDPSWPDDLKAKWFAGFERLMKSSLGE